VIDLGGLTARKKGHTSKTSVQSYAGTYIVVGYKVGEKMRYLLFSELLNNFMNKIIPQKFRIDI